MHAVGGIPLVSKQPCLAVDASMEEVPGRFVVRSTRSVSLREGHLFRGRRARKVEVVDRGWDSVVVDVTVELAHTPLPLPSSTAAREEFA
jgi:hypothetical protein